MLAPPLPRPRALALAAVLGGAAAPAAARAQGGDLSAACAGQPLAARDACQKASDLFAYAAPALGALVAGGNTILGGGGATGGLGRFSIGLRANVVRVPVPEVAALALSRTGPVRSQVGADPTAVPFPVLDAAVGVFAGIPLGITRVGAVDLLVNAAYLPNVGTDDDEVTLRAGNRPELGFGVRVGLLQESALVPSVGVSVLRRGLPATTVRATTDRGDQFGVTDARLTVTSWRLTASKNLLLFNIAAGVGQDAYRASADLTGAVSVPGLGGGAVPFEVGGFSQRLTRRNYFANLTVLNLPFVKLIGEVGRTEGGSLPATFNDFGGRPDQAFTYAALGVRVGR